MKKKLRLPGIIILLTVLLLSCKNNGMGLFVQISNDEQFLDNSLDNSLSVSEILSDGTDYFLSAGSVYQIAASSLLEDTAYTWTAYAAPTGYLNSISIAILSGNVYAIYIPQGTGDTALYSRAISSTTWDPVTTSGITSGEIPQKLWTINNTLFLLTRNSDNVYALYSSSNGTAFSAELTGIPAIVDGTYRGTDYWFITASTLYSGSLSSISETSITGRSGGILRGILSSASGNKLFVSASSGILYSYDGSTWTKQTLTFSGTNIELSTLADFPGTGTPTAILVGTIGLGYFELPVDSIGVDTTLGRPGSTGFSLSSNNTYTTIDLRSTHINTFLIDDYAGNPVILIGTGDNGLWRNYHSSGVSGSWVLE